MPAIPGSIWRRPDMLAALQARDIAQAFRLIRQYAGMSQTVIGSLPPRDSFTGSGRVSSSRAEPAAPEGTVGRLRPHS